MIDLMKRFVGEEEGQTATEYMLIISVIVVAVVAAAYLFLDPFRKGVSQLADDVKTILNSGMINGEGQRR